MRGFRASGFSGERAFGLAGFRAGWRASKQASKQANERANEQDKTYYPPCNIWLTYVINRTVEELNYTCVYISAA